nr:YggS family pyridoxal phosphate-dependent enzyme [Limnoglobus roseus]
MTIDQIRTTLRDRLAHVNGRIAAAATRSGRRPDDVTLIAVSKTAAVEVAAIAFDLGVRDFGESRPQELWKKHTALPAARWHLIGHLQRNKIDKTIPLVSLVHSADSERVLAALSEFGVKRASPVAVLLEVNCSREASKGGFPPESVGQVADAVMSLPGLRLEGLMTMAAYGDDPQTARPTFAELRELRDGLRTRTGLPLPQLSMGMSNDYEIAVEEGATLVRVGSTLFEGLGP